MRNLTHAETALSLTVIGMAASLAYLAWFAPALAQIKSDREATQTLLMRLATERRDTADATPASAPTNMKAQAIRPAIETRAKPRPMVRPTPRPRPVDELRLGDSDDPIDGL